MSSAISNIVAKFSVIALYDYVGQDEDEISFLKDDILEVVREECEDEGWWTARLGDRVGVVPSNYFCILASRTAPSSGVKQLPKKPSIEKIPDAGDVKPQRKLIDSSNVLATSGDLARLKELRKETESKIVALRTAVSKYEESPMSSKEAISGEVDSVAILVQQKLKTQLPKKDRELFEKLNKIISEHTSQTPSSMNPRQSASITLPQINVDPISFMTPSNSDISIRSELDNDVAYTRSKKSSKQVRAPSSERRQAPFEESPRRGAPSPLQTPVSLPRLPGSESKPYLISGNSDKKPLSDGRGHSTPSKPQPTAGFRYPFCRSTVYAPTNADHVLRQSESSMPNASLSLLHVHGYDGDINKHGGSVRGKNIVLLRDNLFAYPAAALVILCDLDQQTQRFFGGHSEEVSAITCHPDRSICASGQLGQDGRILVWSTVGLLPGQMLTSSISELWIRQEVRGVSGINFSGDGRFLVAIGIDDSHTLIVFDWLSGTAIASAKAGHNTVFQMGFNPFLFVAADVYEDQRIVSPRAAEPNAAASGNEHKRGCYCMVTCGGKHIKFWTLQQYVQMNEVDVVPNSGFKGRQMMKPKGKQHPIIRYTLEGHIGTFPKSYNDVTSDILCFSVILDSVGDDKLHPRARILTGTSSGSILIWQQLEAEVKKASKSNNSNNEYLTKLSGWQSRGRLLSVINDVHESPLLDIDYFCSFEDFTAADVDDDAAGVMTEKLITCGKDGMLSVWNINRSKEQRSVPFEHVHSENISSYLPAELLGEPRVVCWTPSANSAIVGTTGNFILSAELQLADFVEKNGSDGNPSPSTTGMFALTINPIVQSHFGKVKRVCAHPTAGLFATISSDRSLRIWSSIQKAQIACVVFSDGLLCCEFTIDGKAILIGTDKGEILLVTCSVLSEPTAFHDPQMSFAVSWEVIIRKFVTSKTSHAISTSSSAVPSIAVSAGPLSRTPSKASMDNNNSSNAGKDKNNNNNNSVRRSEVVEICFSPKGDLVAIGAKDNLIHLLDMANDFKRVAVCRGHTSFIKSLQFSDDGLTLYSTDVVREIFLWDTQTGKGISNVQSTRDINWFTWTSTYGWSVQGVFNGVNGAPMDGEINAVCRSRPWPLSPFQSLIAVGGSNTVNSAVKLFRYPCVSGAVPFGMYGGHACPVVDIRFVNQDKEVVSVGGNDSCIFCWGVKC